MAHRLALAVLTATSTLLSGLSVHAQTTDGEWRGSGGCGIGNIDRYTIQLSIRNANVVGSATAFGQKSGYLPESIRLEGKLDPATGSVTLSDPANARNRYDGKAIGHQMTLNGWSGAACRYTLTSVGAPQTATVPPGVTPPAAPPPPPTPGRSASPTPPAPSPAPPVPRQAAAPEPASPSPSVDPQRTAFAALGTQEMSAVQRALAALGHYRGPIDGSYGPGTAAAIEAWQRSQQLPLTGYLTMAESDRLKNQALAMLGGPSAPPRAAAAPSISTPSVVATPPVPNALPATSSSTGAPTTPATPVLRTAAPSSVHATIGYGSRAGMEVTVVSMEGRDTERAVIKTKHTRDNAIAFCREYVQNVTEQCIRRELAGSLREAITANCQTGEFTDFHGSRYRFLGPNPQGGVLGPKYRIMSVATRQIADGSSASGYLTNMALYRALCPASAPIDIDASVVSTAGRDTASATIRVRYTRENGTQDCQDNAGRVDERCVRSELAKRRDSVSGNCLLGEFTDFYGGRFRFVQKPKADSPGLRYGAVNTTTGESIDASSLKGLTTMAIYRALCPAHAPFES